MAHQDFGKICPPFIDGEEKELIIRGVKGTATISTTFGNIAVGREIYFLDAYAIADQYNTTITVTANAASITIGIYKNTLSTRFGSIVISDSAMATTSADWINPMITGSVTSSVAFTSTDVLCVAIDSQQAGTDKCYAWDVYLRYREK